MTDDNIETEQTVNDGLSIAVSLGGGVLTIEHTPGTVQIKQGDDRVVLIPEELDAVRAALDLRPKEVRDEE